MLTESQIRLALRDCYDPELRLNLVELGMVESIRLEPDPDAPGSGIPGVSPRFRVTVDLLSTGEIEAEETSAAIRAALVRNRLAAFEQLSRIEVQTLPEPLWTPNRVSPEARRLLGLEAQPFAILNNWRP